MLQQMCRTCLATHGELVPIFTNNYYVHNLPDKLKHTISIEVLKDDDLPQMMCKKCVFLVDSLYCFKDQCEMAEVKLKKSLLKSQFSSTRKSARPRDFDFSELNLVRDEEYSDEPSSSEDEYHIEYVSEEARQAVENAKRTRRNAKRRQISNTGVKVKSVEILPIGSKDSSYKNFKKSSSYQHELPIANEETNATDSDVSSSYCMSEDSRKFSKKNSTYKKNQKFAKPGMKRKLDLENSYSQLTKVPKKVMFKDSEYEDENQQYIGVTENSKVSSDFKSKAPAARSLPSTKIDDKLLNKRICSFNLTPSKTISNSLASAETMKPLLDNGANKVSELRIQSLIKHVVLNNPKSCTICSDSFDTYLAMLKHKIQMHLNPEEHCFFCPICQEKFFSHKILVNHLNDHKDVSSFMCVLCSENFYTEEMLRSHLASHVNLSELTCIICSSKKFDRLNNLLSHLDEHINKQLVCTFCIDSFDSKDSLQSHISKEHEGSTENPKPVAKATEIKRKTARVSCPHCKRNFASAAAVEEHISKKHQEFACLVCDKKFPSAEDRNEHTKQFHMKAENTKQPVKKQEQTKKPVKKQEPTKESNTEQEQTKQTNTKQEQTKQTPTKQDQTKPSPTKQDQTKQSPTKQDQTTQSPTKQDQYKQSNTNPGQTMKSPAADRKKFLCRVCHEILISRASYTQHLKDKHPSEILKEMTETSRSEEPDKSIPKKAASDMT